METVLHVLLIFLTVLSSDADMIKRISVPRFSYAGGRINITCEYDITSKEGLYSLKWYHNDTEFYRNVPTEPQRPVILKPNVRFNIQEVSQTNGTVILQLTSLTSEASGEYKCEVIAEHPSFRTETKSSSLRVLDDQLQSPKIEGAKSFYNADETIRLTCVPKPFALSAPALSLVWYINGVKAMNTQHQAEILCYLKYQQTSCRLPPNSSATPSWATSRPARPFESVSPQVSSRTSTPKLSALRAMTQQ